MGREKAQAACLVILLVCVNSSTFNLGLVGKVFDYKCDRLIYLLPIPIDLVV